jgi:serine/threonine protein kinase
MSSSLNPEEIRLDPALAALTTGSQVGGGRFTLRRLLGQGGMGVVWLARDEHLREDVALKFLPPEIRHDAVALDDLRRETSRSRKLTHPHIIRIHDLYKVEQEAFISMEYVAGPNLSELRLEKPDRVLNWKFLEPLVMQLCEALAYAHKENIVHRDLKPANMMLDIRGRLKLADFGIAASVTDSVSRVSMGHHRLSGTASYMSPQQLDGQLPQVTDDIYSLGSTLYELLTSRAPFFTGDIAHQVRTLPPQPIEKRLAQLRLDNPIPPTVSATIMACLAKEPEKRPQSAQAVAQQMKLPRGTPTAAAAAPAPSKSTAPAEPPPASTAPVEAQQPPVPVVPAEPQRAPTGKAANGSEPKTRADSSRPARRTKRAAKRRSPLLAVAAVVALLAIAGGGWWWWSHSRRQAAPKTAAAVVPEFVSLFNGRDFSGWDGDPQIWSVKEGTIVATAGTSKERRPVALFWRDGTVDDFELQLSFRIKTGNSGIYYRAKQLLAHEVGGYQFEISGPQTGTLLETGSDRTRRDPSRLGSITTARLIDGKDKVKVEGPTESSEVDVKNAFRHTGWNDVVIIAQGNRIIHKLNGHTMVDVTDHSEKRPRSGVIALEVYGAIPTTVQYRDIRLKRLAPTPPARPVKQ